MRDFSLGADAKYGHDDDHSLWAAMTDNDQYGSGPLAETGPNPGQAGYKNAKMREKKRQNAAIKMICDHILDERLKDMIKDQCTSARKGTEAWALILSECSEEATDLHVLDEKKKFAELTIEKDVGYDVESITSLTRRMHLPWNGGSTRSRPTQAHSHAIHLHREAILQVPQWSQHQSMDYANRSEPRWS